MNFGALFKVVLWTAPVLAFIFLYISQQQQEQKQEMKIETAEFDKEFAAMNKSMASTKEEKAFWNEQLVENKAKINDIKNSKTSDKSDLMLKQVENELNLTKQSDFPPNMSSQKIKGD